MADDITIDYALDPSGYLSGAQQIAAANAGMQRSFGATATSSSLVGKALDVITPKRAGMLAWGAMAKSAADVEQSMSGLQAVSAVTGVNTAKLSGTVRQLARDLPLGSQAALATVQQFTQMGVAGAGTEAKIAKLTTTAMKLSGATGEAPQALAQGMTELARATGNVNLDPVRFAKLGDSLTSVSAQSGASATNILSFSKSIAPMAQAAGIGSTGVLGISSAFARLGEDGIGASTAVNKMLTDMSRSVREGTPELKTYARITGQTVEAFTALAKTNPAEALTQVTESIAKSGSGGPRILEQLGLDGVRSMRSLQALSSSGGLRPAIASATAAYGSGSTEAASSAAFSGLNDSVTELEASAKQLGDAFGAPLLGPLTAFTNALKIPVNAARAVVESSFMQKAIQVAAVTAVPLMMAKGVVGTAMTLFAGRQALTSGPAKSLVAGWASGGAGIDTAAQRYGAQAQKLAETGTLRTTGLMGGANQWLYEKGQAVRQGHETAIESRLGPEAYAQRRAAQASGIGPSFKERLGTVAGGVRTYSNVAATAVTNQLSESIRNSRVPFPERTSTFGLGRQGDLAGGVYTEARQGGQGVIAASTKSVQAFNAQVTGATKGLGTFSGSAAAASKTIMEGARASASMAGGGVGKGVGAVGAVGGGGMLAGMGITAAIAGIGALATLASSNMAKAKQTTEDYANSDVSTELNAYKESIGKATDTTKTVNSLSMDLGKTIAKNTSTFSQATTITQDDVKVAEATKDQVTTKYVGNDPKGVAAQVAGITPGGLAPDELQAVKVDLLRQYSQKDTEAILGQLPESAKATGDPIIGTNTKNISDMVTALSGAGQSSGAAGFGAGAINAVFGRGTSQSSDSWNPMAKLFGTGGAFAVSGMSDEQNKQADAVGQGIQTQYGKQSDRYGTDYAEQERQKGQQAAIDAAMKTDNPDLVAKLAKNFSIQTLGKDNAQNISVDDLKAHDGNLAATMAAGNDAYKGKLAEFTDRQNAAGGGGFNANQIQDSTSKLLAPISKDFSDFFDNRRTNNAASAAVSASLDQPGNTALQTEAVNAMVANAKAAGTSMADFAAAGTRAASKLDEAGDQFALIQAAIAKAQQQLGKENQDKSPGQAFMATYDFVSKQAAQPASSNPEVNKQIQGFVQQQIDMEGQAKDRLKARLQSQRDYEIGSGRATEDFNTQRKYAETDYGIQVARTQRNFQTQMRRQQEDYQISVTRSTQDYNTQRARMIRDFNISMQRSEEDFQKQRARSIRDFNISMARTIEDAAKTLYDPYTRIQTKATWDAKNLLQNLAEQATAMAKQQTDLDKLRGMGLSGASIDQLQLGKVENAQQVTNLVDDLTKDPSIVAQLNEAATTRAGLAAQFVSDASNIDTKRAQEDFRKTLSDQDVDRKTSLDRAKADLAKTLGDQVHDFTLALARGNEEYSKSVGRAGQDLAIGLADNEQTFSTSMARQRTAFGVEMTRMHENLMNQDLVISGDIKTLTEQVNRALHGQTVNWGVLITNDTEAWVSNITNVVIPRLTAALAAAATATAMANGTYIVNDGAGHTAAQTTGGYAAKYAAMDRASGWQAEGGPVLGSSPHPKADDKLIRATSGEFVQPVAAVQHYGMAGMEAIRTQKIPKKALLGYAEGGLVNSAMVSVEQGKSMRAAEGGGLTVHNHHEQITYDSRNDFGNAQITVQAQDPDEMARKLEARKRRFSIGKVTVGAGR